MEKKKKDKLFAIVIVAAIAVGTAWTFLTGPEHIEDTNGPDNFSINRITDEEIIKGDYGTTGSLQKGSSQINLGGGVTISSSVKFATKKFTGVYDLVWADYILPSDFEITLYNLQVTGGNFEIMLINDGKIIDHIDINGDGYLRVDNLTGNTVLRLVAESAAFSFEVSQSDFDMFEHYE